MAWNGPVVNKPLDWHFIKIPNTRDEFVHLIDLFIVDLDNFKPGTDEKQIRSWMRSVQCLNCIKSLLDQGKNFDFHFTEINHSKFCYEIDIASTNFKLEVRWKNRMRIIFCRAARKMEAQVNDPITLDSPELDTVLYHHPNLAGHNERNFATECYIENMLYTDFDKFVDIILGRVPLIQEPRFIEAPADIYIGDLFVDEEIDQEETIVVHLVRSVWLRRLYFDSSNRALAIKLRPFTKMLTSNRCAYFDCHYLEAQALFGIDINHNFPALDSLNDVLANFSHRFGWDATITQKCISFISGLAALWRTREDPITCSFVLTSILSSFNLSFNVVTACVTQISKVLASVFRMQAQSMTVELITPIVTGICVLMSALLLDRIPSAKTIDDACKKLNILGRGIQGGNTIFTFLETHIGTMVDYFYELFTGLPRHSVHLSKYLSEIDEWMIEVEFLALWETQDLSHIDTDTCDRIERCYMRSLSFSKQLSQFKLTQKDLLPFHTYTRVISKIYDRVIASGRRPYSPRVEPTVIHFYGESGVGKSTLLQYVAQDLMFHEDPDMPSKMLDQIYTRNVEQHFWDDYGGQFITVYDDFGQIADSNASPNLEFMELIRCGNMTKYPLPMAALEEKSKTHFTSKVVLLTSNQANYATTSLTCPDAVKRRKDLLIEVSVKPEFLLAGTSRLDPSKCLSSIDSSYYVFRTHNPTNKNEPPSAPMNYDQMLALVLGVYDRKKAMCNNRIQLLTNRYQQKLGKLETFHDTQTEMIVQNSNWIEDACGTLQECRDNDCDVKLVFPKLSPTHYAALLCCVQQDPNNSLLSFLTYVAEHDLGESDFEGAKPNFSSYLYKKIRQAPLMLTFMRKQRDIWLATGKQTLETFWNSQNSQKMKMVAQLLSVMLGAIGIGALFYKFSSKTKTLEKSNLVSNRQYAFVEATSNDFKTITRRNKIKTEATSGDFRTVRTRTMRTECRMPATITESHLESQAALDPNQKDLISNSIYRNLYRLIKVRGGVEVPLMNILFVKGRCAIMPSHGLGPLEDADAIILRNDFQHEGFTMPPSTILDNIIEILDSAQTTKDAVMIAFPNFLPTHRDISKHFIERKKLDSCAEFTASIPLLHFDQSRWIHSIYSGLSCWVNSHQEYFLKDKPIRLRHSYQYRCDTDKGDCGSPLVVAGKSVNRKIVGFHVAGGTGFGCSTSITCEDLEACFRLAPMSAQVSLVLPEEVDEEVSVTLPSGNFTPCGRLPRSYAPPLKTSLRKSALYGKLDPPITAPSVLAPVYIDDKLIDPLTQGLEKCGTAPVWIDPEIIERAALNYTQLALADSKHSIRRVLTLEESIQGIIDADFIDPINRRSAPGYPWVNFRKGGSLGKTQWLGDMDYILDDPDVKRAVDLRIENAKIGIRTPVLWVDTLKDERRPFSKIDLAKTRVFSAGCMDYILVFRQYFLAFNAHIMKNMLSNECAVGIDPYSISWDLLAKKLQKKGNAVVAGDFSNFDGTLSSQILYRILDIINDFYDDGEENRKIRTVLWDDIVNSVHIYRNNVYQWTHSQPSGNPCTVIINSIYNSISMRIAWDMCTVGTSCAGIHQFNKYVSMISYGDDNVLNIDETALEFFNQDTISNAYSKLGMKYTMENKSEENIVYRSLDQVSFLKRAFRYDSKSRLYKAPLDLAVVLEMVNWVKGDTNQEDSLVENIKIAYHELSLHDRQIFDYQTKRISKLCVSNLRKQPELLTYQEYKNIDYSKLF